MPWQETLLMDQRVQFIADYQRDVFDVARNPDIAVLVEAAEQGSAVVIVTSDPRVVLSGVRHLTLEAGDIVSDLRIPVARAVSTAVGQRR